MENIDEEILHSKLKGHLQIKELLLQDMNDIYMLVVLGRIKADEVDNILSEYCEIMKKLDNLRQSKYS